MTTYLDGKIVDPKNLPSDAKLTREVHAKYYETPKYSADQALGASAYFKRQQEMRDDLEKRHG